MSKEIVDNSASLRGQGKYRDAIDVVMKSPDELDEFSRIPALIQAFYAARDAGFTDEARAIAKLISHEEPDFPAIQKYI